MPTLLDTDGVSLTETDCEGVGVTVREWDERTSTMVRVGRRRMDARAGERGVEGEGRGGEEGTMARREGEEKRDGVRKKKRGRKGCETWTRVCRDGRLTGVMVDGTKRTAVAQDVPHQEEAGEETEAKQAHPAVDPLPHRKHHPLQRQTQTLASHQAQPVVRIWVVTCHTLGSNQGVLWFYYIDEKILPERSDVSSMEVAQLRSGAQKNGCRKAALAVNLPPMKRSRLQMSLHAKSHARPRLQSNNEKSYLDAEGLSSLQACKS